MAAGPLMVNGVQMIPKDGGGSGGDGTVLNIHITQESCLSSLLKAVAAARQKKPQPDSKLAEGAAPGGRAWRQTALGAAQILLGLVCISLGAVIYLQRSYQRVIYTGAPFWMGGLYILSGVFSVVGERRGGSWIPVAAFANLAGVVAGSVALGYGVADIPSLSYYPERFDYICKPNSHQPWWATPTPSPAYDWRVEECKRTLTDFSVVAAAVHLLLLIYAILGLIIALVCFGSSLRTLCCSLRDCSRAYVALGDQEAPPASEHPVV